MVLILVAMTSVVAATLVKERVLSARIRVVSDQLAYDLRAARLKAVSQRAAVDVVVTTDPANTYAYTDARGHLQTRDMPPGVRIVSSNNPIRFQTNGSVIGGASTVLETDLSTFATERWTVDTTVLGNPRVSHVKVTP